MVRRVVCGMFALLLLIPAMLIAASPSPPVTVPFVLDHNRVFVDVEFPGAAVKLRSARAFVDMGAPDFTFAEDLANELRLGQINKLNIWLGGTPLFIDYTKVTAEIYGVKSIAAAGTVEVNLPAVVLMNYDMVLDYGVRTLTLAASGTIQHKGVRIPCVVDQKTGLVAIKVGVGSHMYAMTIDNGSAYTWIRKALVRKWVDTHPDWLRGIGAVGDANMNGTEAETTALLARIPLIKVGALQLRHVGLAGYAEKIAGNQQFFDWYSKKAPQPVIGFIGGNILKSFRIEIDYAKHATYWLQEMPIDRDDMAQVPVVLRPERDGTYTVIGICRRNGKKLMNGVLPGDKLVAIGGLAVRNATFGTVLRALHGQPGDKRVLVLERNGRPVKITVTVESV